MFVLGTPFIQVHPGSGLSEPGLAHASLTRRCEAGQEILTSCIASLSCARARGGVVLGSLEPSLWASVSQENLSQDNRLVSPKEGQTQSVRSLCPVFPGDRVSLTGYVADFSRLVSTMWEVCVAATLVATDPLKRHGKVWYLWQKMWVNVVCT